MCTKFGDLPRSHEVSLGFQVRQGRRAEHKGPVLNILGDAALCSHNGAVAHVNVTCQAGLAGHVHVGDGAVVGAQSGIAKDVEDGTFVFGTPALPHLEAKRNFMAARQVPKLRAHLRDLEGRIQKIEGAMDQASAQG